MTFPLRRVGRTDVHVTEYGLGGGPFGNLLSPMSNAAADGVIRSAWDAGFRYFDTAPLYGYGLSERRLGLTLHELPTEGRTVSTKIGRVLTPGMSEHPFRWLFPDSSPFGATFDYSYDAVMRSHEDSLQRLGVDKVDILYVHDLAVETHGQAEFDRHFKVAMDSGYKAMDELRRNGDVAAIGLGVNEWEACDAAMDHGRWDVFLLAGRFTLLEQTPLDSFLPRCEREGVSLVIGGPLNSGILAKGAVPGATYNYEPAPEAIMTRVAAIEAICREHDVPLPAAALQFPLKHPSVASIIPGMASPEQMKWNLEHMKRPIPQALWTDLAAAGLLHPAAPIGA